ncbi:MAG TPA: beta-galactosidase, partial [Polyangia bacterium]|nr:beta-galactosidase [Polyangia bacterium]
MTDLSRRGVLQGTLAGTSLLALPGRLLAAAPIDVERYPPVISRFPHILHGGDWNPDQWLDEPGIIDEDFRLMEKAHCNTFSVGIFAWSHLEPEEGKFTFEWLDKILDGLATRGWNAFLATPSGAKPRWLSEKYPEVRRINADGHREPHANRHNHCFTSPVYRKKVRLINTRLAARYRNHKALCAWHVSNEYNGACYCELCLAAFRAWLKGRYGTLDNLNQKWWTAFWSQTFQDWKQIDPRQTPVDGLLLDWDRFVTHQTVDFMKGEVQPLRAAT